MCVCVWGGVGGRGDLMPPSPVICKEGLKLTDYTSYQGLVPSVLL